MSYGKRYGSQEGNEEAEEEERKVETGGSLFRLPLFGLEGNFRGERNGAGVA